jgi:hypothetical protein
MGGRWPDAIFATSFQSSDNCLMVSSDSGGGEYTEYNRFSGMLQ